MFQIKSFLLDCTSGPGFGEYYILVDKFEYGKTVDGIELQRFYSTTAIYTPITIQNNNIYIVPGCNRFGEKNPVAASIDLKNKEVNHLPFEYPKFPGADNKNKRAV